MSSFSKDEYRRAEGAKDLYKEAVSKIMDGEATELKRLLYSFLERNQDVTMEDILEQFHSEGKTLLHLAANSGHLNVANFIISESKNPRKLVNLVDNGGFTPLINATISESVTVMTMLLGLGAEVNARNKDGAAAIHFAAGDGKVERLQVLCDAGADLTLLSEAGSPLHWACGKGHVEAVRYIISKGVDVNARSSSGLPAIFLAAAAFSDECVSALVDAGADLGFIVTGNLTLLHMCAENGLISSVARILEAQSDVGRECAKILTVDGNVPCHLAAMAEFRQIVELLLPFTPWGALPRESLSDAVQSLPPGLLFTPALISPGSTFNALIDSIIADGKIRLQQWEAKYNSPNQPKETPVTAPVIPEIVPVTDPEIIAKADTLKVVGNGHFSRGEFREAVEAYGQACSLQPDNHVLWSNASAAKLSAGDLEGAVRDAEVCRRLDPKWSKGCYRLAAARLALGLYEDAAVAAFEGTKLDENNSELKKILKEAVRLGRLEYEKKENKSS